MVFWRRRAKQPADKEPQLLVQQPGTPPRSWEPGFLEYVLQSRRTQAAQVAESNDEETSPSPIETCRDVWAAVLSNLQPKDLARAGVRTSVFRLCSMESGLFHVKFVPKRVLVACLGCCAGGLQGLARGSRDAISAACVFHVSLGAQCSSGRATCLELCSGGQTALVHPACKHMCFCRRSHVL
jgi:hypothetical protein